MKFRTSFLASVLALALVGCGSPKASETQAAFSVIHSESSQQASFDVVQITADLDEPWGLAFLPDGDFLITQKPGGMVRVSAKTGDITPIPGAPEPLYLRQGGLLDLALSPEFESDHLLYFSYAEGTKKQNHTAIARAKLLDDALQDVQILFRANTDEKSGGAHFGSRLLFDRDGYLFASVGDGFRWLKQAQNPKSHFGSILRLHPDGSIPEDNPFADGVEGAPEVWSYGHRNPQGLALHPRTGKVWESEHGPRGGDEVNIIEKGANYGWPKATFGRGYSGKTISKFTELPGMVSPILHWTPSIAACGLDFYTGDKFPQWQGDLFSGALAGQHLRRIELNGETRVSEERLLVDLEERIRQVRNGPDGYLYVLTDGGQLLRLQPGKN
jgi:glucose/arabinose dehydrogenase